VDYFQCLKCYVCVYTCPSGAIKQRADGFIDIDYNKCNFCYICSKTCPYGAIFPALDKSVGADIITDQSGLKLSSSTEQSPGEAY